MNELRRLIGDRSDHFWMAVPCRADGDARREIEKAVSVDVFDRRAESAGDHERIQPRI
jgi:hypothetical protein